MAELGDTIIKGDLNVLGNISTNGTGGTSDSYTKTEIDTKLGTKQDKLTAGTNITIANNTISAKDTTYSTATSSADGLMSKKDKSKLDNIFKSIYPVGSVYISVNSTNPSTLFGGTWTQIKDRFLLACGSTYKAGATGGEATHSLTKNEIPHIGSGVGYGGNGIAGGSGWTDTWLGGSDEVGKPHNNMPPYLTVYVWKRTA